MPAFTGTSGPDTFNGTASDDLVSGGDGDDVLNGAAGDDTISGDGGIDIISDSSGSDHLLGGAGIDYIFADHTQVAQPGPQSLMLDGGEGDDTLRVYANTAFFPQAGLLSATILGGAGDDEIITRNDMALTVNAGDGNDALIISGLRSHSAVFTLGAGADTLTLQNTGGWTGVATITDFQTGAGGDRLSIEPDLYILNWDHTTNPFSQGYFRLEQVGSDTVLQVDDDGSGNSGVFQDFVRFQNTQASAFTAFNLFGFAPVSHETPITTQSGTAGADTLTGGEGFDSLQGLGGGDVLHGQAGDDTIDGGDGNDEIEGGPGIDSLSGGAGDDRIFGASANSDLRGDTLLGGDGNDWLTSSGAASLLDGGAGDDTLEGGSADDQIIGGAGGDFIRGFGGADTLDGGAGDDTLQGGSGAVITTGGGADLILIGDASTDARTQSGLETVTDWSDSDKIKLLNSGGFERTGTYSETTAPDYGSALSAAEGHFRPGDSDVVAVQVGSDVIVFAEDGGPVHGAPGGLVLAGRTLADISAANIDGAVDGGTFTTSPVSPPPPPVTELPPPIGTVQNGTDGNDVINATPNVSEVHAGSGADTVTGGPTQDYLRGDDGDDSIQGGAAFDDINGNKGQDTLEGGAGGHDWLVGGQGNDLITGRQADILWGNLGNDTLHGGATNAQLRGGQGDDSIAGGSGNEFISGDRGNDTESGGAGADLFHGSQDAGIDRVLDFSAAGGDRVMLDPGTIYALRQVGADTVIDMGAGAGGPNQMILVGVQMSTLKDGWIFEG